MTKDQEVKVTEATCEVAKCVLDAFTGTLVLEFQAGVPMVCKKTDTKRFGRKAPQARLDAGSQPK